MFAVVVVLVIVVVVVVAFVVVVVIAVCRCGCGSVVTAVVGHCSCCGRPYGYLSRSLVSLPPPVELLESTRIVIVRWVVGVIMVAVVRVL